MKRRRSNEWYIPRVARAAQLVERGASVTAACAKAGIQASQFYRWVKAGKVKVAGARGAAMVRKAARTRLDRTQLNGYKEAELVAARVSAMEHPAAALAGAIANVVRHVVRAELRAMLEERP
ncbi:MAG TPA: transposase [Gemmatimonadales bacterium]